MANDDFPELTDLMRDIRILPMDREASTTRPTSACGYGFVPVQREHLPLLRRWLEAPHVSKWWGNPDHEIDLIEGGSASHGSSPSWPRSMDARSPTSRPTMYTPSPPANTSTSRRAAGAWTLSSARPT